MMAAANKDIPLAESPTTHKAVIKIGLHPDNTKITNSLIIGSAIFGFGWGVAGSCPGPAIVNLGAGMYASNVYVPALLGGMMLHYFFF